MDITYNFKSTNRFHAQDHIGERILKNTMDLPNELEKSKEANRIKGLLEPRAEHVEENRKRKLESPVIPTRFEGVVKEEGFISKNFQKFIPVYKTAQNVNKDAKAPIGVFVVDMVRDVATYVPYDKTVNVFKNQQEASTTIASIINNKTGTMYLAVNDMDQLTVSENLFNSIGTSIVGQDPDGSPTKKAKVDIGEAIQNLSK